KGNGNSNSPKSYSFTDANLSGGNKFSYRLKQLDNDGSFEYSDIVEVELVTEEYALSQNYPNPFNPVTFVQFELPAETEVSLIIYDMLGQEVVTLVNGKMSAGIHTINFNARNLPSGTYVYRLTAGSFSDIKKMILLK
ncbi:MAG: T9SS type A sorting domain-containing protein, partial [Ignavibacteria bacterium]